MCSSDLPFWRQTVAQKSTENRDFLAGKGMVIDEIDYPAFRAAMAPVYAEFKDKIGAELVDRVLKETQG